MNHNNFSVGIRSKSVVLLGQMLVLPILVNRVPPGIQLGAQQGNEIRTVGS